MNTFRRWTTSLLSSFESVISQIENHEAMVTAAIREAEENGAHAKAQLARVRRDGQNMRKRIMELRDQSETWRERTRKVAAEDEKKAIECLRRSRRAERQVTDLEQQEREHAKLEKELSRDLGTVEERLVALRQQRNIMRTRQSRAEALRLIQQVDSRAVCEIDDIFMRWEAQVATCESRSKLDAHQSDELDEELSTREEEEELMQILREITSADAKAAL